MVLKLDNVHICNITEDGQFLNKSSSGVTVLLNNTASNQSIHVLNGTQLMHNIPIAKATEAVKVGEKSMVITSNDLSYMLNFNGVKDMKNFEMTLKSLISSSESSIFHQRTDASSADQYFQFYGYMSQQQNMMQDYIRTSTYQRAMLDNVLDFQDKVVLDVGAGSGILSFFAIQAGARKVYAIEASTMAQHCQILVDNNKLSREIIVMAGKIEEVDIPEKVDIIISEPMGYMLFNERMLETYLHAKKWLKPGGKMFPSQGDLHIAPFTDEALYMEQCSKANFWYQNSFHSVDLSSLRETAIQEYFRQPIVDTFDIRICLARSHKYTVDFQTADESDLYNMDIPISFTMMQSGTIHGLAFWFDVAFLGSQATVWLSTAPTQPLTHWYQVRCLLQSPIFAKQGQLLVGRVHLKSNKRQSYDVDISLSIPGTTIKSSNSLDLKNPFFRYTGQQPQPPPGNNHSSPSDAYWNQQDPSALPSNGYNIGMMNGGMGDGSQLLQQLAHNPNIYHNVLPLGNNVSNTIGTALSQQNRNSALSPILLAQQSHAPGSSSTNHMTGGGVSSLNHQYMIGDYMLPSNSVFSSQPTPLSLLNFKATGQ